jgi:hypothetical protein
MSDTAERGLGGSSGRRVKLKGLPRFEYSEDEIALLEDAGASVYRWWYEFLRLSQDYWFLCQVTNGPPQTGDARLAQVYRDFRDVFRLPFETWWKVRGINLFYEIIAPKTVRIHHGIPNDVDRIKRDRWGSIVIEIPLSLTKMTIMKQVSKIISNYTDSRPKNRLETSKAHYPLNPVRYRVHTLRVTHAVHCLHRQMITRRKFIEEHGNDDHSIKNLPKIDHYEIGRILQLNARAEKLTGDEREIARRKNTMRATVGRYLSRAELLIANVEIGEFPKFKPVEPCRNRFTDAQIKARDSMRAEWLSINPFSEVTERRIDYLVHQAGLPALDHWRR